MSHYSNIPQGHRVMTCTPPGHRQQAAAASAPRLELRHGAEASGDGPPQEEDQGADPKSWWTSPFWWILPAKNGGIEA